MRIAPTRLFVCSLIAAVLLAWTGTATAQSRLNCGPYFQRVIDNLGAVQCRTYSAAARLQVMKSRELTHKQLIKTRKLQVGQRSRTVVKDQATVQLETVQSDLEKSIEMHQKQTEEKVKEDIARREWLFN